MTIVDKTYPNDHFARVSTFPVAVPFFGLVFCLLSTAIVRDAFIIWVEEFELGLYFMFLR